MLRRTDELEVFKTRINLSEYAAAQGYVLDRKASSRNSAIMRNGAGTRSSSREVRTGTGSIFLSGVASFREETGQPIFQELAEAMQWSRPSGVLPFSRRD